jgi:NADPH:quinone reductase-like Zn-dependent oxidoreductase
MFALAATRFDPGDPLAALDAGEYPEPEPPDGWEVVEVRATSLNHHDLWSLRGVGLSECRLPMILGCDAAGVAPDGREVVVHAVVAGDGTGAEVPGSPDLSILSERYPGTHAERVAAPRRNLLAKPAGLSFAEAACLPTAWLTAFRMLFTQAALRPGDRVLVQGAGGGVATALVLLGRGAGLRVYVTSRDEAKRERALGVGASGAFAPGERLPERVDAVMETVGEATWAHSLRALRPGGTLVVAGATSGPNPPADLQRVFFRQLRIVGSTMGTRDDFEGLLRMLQETGVRPLVDATFALTEGRTAYERLAGGEVFGKLVLTTD